MFEKKFSKKQQQLIDLIKITVFKFYNIPIKLSISRSRNDTIIKAKSVSIYFIKKFFPETTLATIADIFNYKNTSTVLYHYKNIKSIQEVDIKFRNTITSIENTISNKIILYKIEKNQLSNIENILVSLEEDISNLQNNIHIYTEAIKQLEL